MSSLLLTCVYMCLRSLHNIFFLYFVLNVKYEFDLYIQKICELCLRSCEKSSEYFNILESNEKIEKKNRNFKFEKFQKDRNHMTNVALFFYIFFCRSFKTHKYMFNVNSIFFFPSSAFWKLMTKQRIKLRKHLYQYFYLWLL